MKKVFFFSFSPQNCVNRSVLSFDNTHLDIHHSHSLGTEWLKSRHYSTSSSSPQSRFWTQMNSSHQKTSPIPVVNMWIGTLLQNSPSLHVWHYAYSLFALKHHQSVDSVTGICFCILKPSAFGETIEKRHLQTKPLMLIDSYHCFCLQPFSFSSLLFVLIISCNLSFHLLFDHHVSYPIFLCFYLTLLIPYV